MARIPILLAVAMLWHPSTAVASPELVVRNDNDGLVDRPFTVAVRGAPPNALVRIEASFDDEQTPSQRWTASGEFRADRKGFVDTGRFASLNGTYRGVVAGGLMCSALPVPPGEVQAFMAALSGKPARTFPLLGTRDRYAVAVNASVNGNSLASTTIVRRHWADGVTVTDVTEGQVRGQYFQPGKVTGIPVVVIAGSAGGLARDHAYRLASRGHPVLALAFFNYPGLPSFLAESPLEIHRDGLAWLSKRTGVAHLAIMGTSRGTEAALLAAAYFPERVAKVIVNMPSPLIHGGFGQGGGLGAAAWTLDGRPLPFLTLSKRMSATEREKAGLKPPGVSDRDAFLAEWTQPSSYEKASIPYNLINVPVLAIGGEQDAAWPSAYGATKIGERMQMLGKGKLVEVHNYRDVGHTASRVGIASEISSFQVHSVSKQWSSNGGVPEKNCAAGYDFWPRVLKFLERP